MVNFCPTFLILLFSLIFPSLTLSATLEKRATCTPTSHQKAGEDDVPAIAAAIQQCGNGGVIVIPAGITYQLGSTLEFTGCKGCELQIEGTLKLTDDLDAWEGVKAIILLQDVAKATIHSVTGTGLVDGNGVPYWTEFNSNSSYKRPTLMYIDGGSDITIENLLFRNAPNVFQSVTGGATRILYSGLTMQAIATSTVTPKNTDGFDVGTSTYVTITNTVVDNQDDCVAFKAGANYVTVTDITCSGSHGLSVGSLASSNNDVVQNVYVSGANMINSAKAVGIKLYDGSSGHGVATVSNVTFDDVTVNGCDYAAQIQVCYNAASGSCVASSHKITNVKFTNFHGTTDSKEAPVVANLDCPADGTCGITFSNFNVNPPSGSAKILCSSVPSSAGITCGGTASG